MTATKTTTRELFVRTRRAWNDGSKIEIDFTSVVKINDKIDHISNHTVILCGWNGKNTCTCQGFARWGRCCHLTHFIKVEGLRKAVVAAEQPKQSIGTVVALINLVAGKSVVSIGAAIPVPEKQRDQMTIDESKQREWDRLMEEHPPVLARERRDTALAEARATSEAELARIEAETLAQIEAEQAVTPGVGKSEQARLADLPLSNDEKKYQRWSREERVNSAPLNGNRAFSVLKSA